MFKGWQLFGFTEFLAWILEEWMAFLVKTFDHHPIHLLLLRPGETFSNQLETSKKGSNLGSSQSVLNKPKTILTVLKRG